MDFLLYFVPSQGYFLHEEDDGAENKRNRKEDDPKQEKRS